MKGSSAGIQEALLDRVRRSAAAGLLLTALAASPAGAATVSSTQVSHDCTRYGCQVSAGIFFTADPGEANRLTVTLAADGVTFADTGAPLKVSSHPGSEPCTQVDDHTVRCPPAHVTVELGDGDDEATGDLSTVSGGPGADRITGGPRPERIDGGPGADVLDGGGGRDTVDYSARRDPVRIDLTGGSGGEDRLTGFEIALGGRGADTVSGGSAPERLVGGSGGDRLDGGGGDDVLEGGTGADRLRGGAGADRLDPGHRDEHWESQEGNQEEVTDRDPDRDPDRVDCGGGRDRVTWVSARDRVHRACERIAFEDGGDDYDEVDSETFLAAPVEVTRSGATLRVGCLGPATCQEVQVVLLSTRGRVLGRSAKRDVPAFRQRRLTVRAPSLPSRFVVRVRAVSGRGAVELTR